MANPILPFKICLTFTNFARSLQGRKLRKLIEAGIALGTLLSMKYVINNSILGIRKGVYRHKVVARNVTSRQLR